MKNTFLLTKVARSMLIAGMVLGITSAVYAQMDAGSAAGGGNAGISVGSVGSGGIPGQAGSEMSGMSKALPGLGQDSSMSGALPRLGQDSSMSRPALPGLKSSAEPRRTPALEPEIPPGKKRTSGASSRMKGSDWIGGESTGMGVGSRD